MGAIEMDQTASGGGGASRLSLGEAFRLQIAPGLANTALFVPAAYVLYQAELPIMFALGIGILFGEVPVAWWIMIRRVRAESGHFSFGKAFPWAKALSWKTYLLLGIPIVVVSVGVMFFGQTVMSPAVQGAFFAWVPQWIDMNPSMEAMMEMDRSVLVALWVMSILVFSLVGGITQELYSRGFLLPRMAHWGLAAPVLNAVLFAMLHLASPWSWPVFFVIALIWALAVWFTRSIKIGLFGHLGMLLLQSTMFALLIARVG